MDARAHPATQPDAPPSELVKSALERLLTGGKLKLSERNRRFLAFVVSETLAGRGERIKAYTIAVDVFGGAHFDPTNDSIVRIEATRLRSALTAYYEHMDPDEHVKDLAASRRLAMSPTSHLSTVTLARTPIVAIQRARAALA